MSPQAITRIINPIFAIAVTVNALCVLHYIRRWGPIKSLSFCFRFSIVSLQFFNSLNFHSLTHNNRKNNGVHPINKLKTTWNSVVLNIKKKIFRLSHIHTSQVYKNDEYIRKMFNPLTHNLFVGNLTHVTITCSQLTTVSFRYIRVTAHRKNSNTWIKRTIFIYQTARG